MASVQVLPNSSRKQEHLEAGKRRLEEFRKKKADGKANQASSHNRSQSVNITFSRNQLSEIQQARNTDADVVGTSDETERAVIKLNYAPTTDQDSIKFKGSGFADLVGINYSDHMRVKNDNLGFRTKSHGSLDHYNSSKESGVLHQETLRDADISPSQSSYIEMDEDLSREKHNSLKDSSFSNGSVSDILDANASFSGSFLQQGNSGYVSTAGNNNTSMTYKDSINLIPRMAGSAHDLREHKDPSPAFNYPIVSDVTEQNPSSSVDNSTSLYTALVQTSQKFPTASNLDFRGFPNRVSQLPNMDESNSSRTRPSFLDSLNISRSSTSPFSLNEREQSFSYMSDTYNIPGFQSSPSPKSHPETLDSLSELRTLNSPVAFPRSVNSTVSNTDSANQLRQAVTDFGMEKKNQFNLQQDEDFSSLEQHIEDLTQEKFSLQRALEASRALAESLAAENSALTNSYNNQGGFVSQLKENIQKLQEEITAQLVEFESVKVGYENAQLECSAADERAKLLASEVIGLEEKALRLRSNELKLERQLEKSQAENFSCKKRISSLERECQDFHSTIDALREETRLLQSKLKGSVSANLTGVDKIPSIKKEASTSTDDLDTHVGAPNLEISSFTSIPDNDFSSSLSANVEASSVNIPSDQMKTIHNINILISELSMEKEELMRVLNAELCNSSHLKDVNSELSRKLGLQTQRVELLSAESMANKSIPLRKQDDPDHSMEHITAYADEGDEVVERVVGWIMKFFPGGASRRRTSKRF